MSEERYYSAEYGYDDAISVVGDGDCKLASFSRPKNSSEEEWFAYGSDEDEDAIANLAVYMRDELRACIVERDKARVINNELVEALEAAKQFIQNGIQYGYINMPDKDCGDSALETHAKIEAAIQKARGRL